MATVTELRDQLTNLEVPNRGINEPLSPPDLFNKKLFRFEEEIYNLHQDSHLFRFLLALCGEGGAGSIKKEILYSKLQSTLASTHFHDLDNLYGDPLALPRIASEIYAYDPKNEVLTLTEWTEVYAKDANYRNRCLLWMRAIIYGGSVMGMRLAAEAACGVECDIFEVAEYNDNQRSDHPLTMTNLGQTTSDGEFVIVPRINSITQTDRHRIISMVDRIRPVDTLVTISLGNTLRTQKIPASVTATSEYSQVQRLVRGRTDISWPDVGRRSSRNLLRNGGAEIAGGWGVNSGILTTTSTETAPKFGTFVFKSTANSSSGGYYYADSSQGEITGATAGRTFTGSAWVKGVGSTIGKTVQVFVSEVGGAGGESTTGTITGSVTLSGEWQRVWGQKTFVSNDRTVARVYISQQNAALTGDVFYFDGVQLEERTSPTPYIATALPNGGPVSATGVANSGMWIVGGEEREAPTYAWIGRQESATFLDINSVSSSSEHYGRFNQTQEQLFPHLALPTDDSFYVYSDEFSFAQAFAQIALSIPWQRNDQVLVNNYYPLDYLQQVDLAQFNVSPTHHFWASEEGLPDSDREIFFDSFATDFANWLPNDTNTSMGATLETGLKLFNANANEDDYMFRTIPIEPNTTYVLSADLSIQSFTGAAILNRGFYAITIDMTGNYNSTSISDNITSANSAGHKQITLTTRANDRWMVIRLYAPQGTVYWNSVSVRKQNSGEEFLTFDFGRDRPVSYVDFEISQKPIDISVEYLAENNLLAGYNSDFETDYTTYNSGNTFWWLYYSEGVNGTKTRDTSVFHSGTASTRVNVLNANDRTGLSIANIPVQSNVTYKFSAWVKGVKGRTMQLLANGFTNLNAVGSTTGNIFNFTGSDDWQLMEIEFTTPDNTNYVYLYVIAENPLGEGVFWVDDVKLSVYPEVWTDVTPTAGTDYTFGISYLVSQQPWRFWRLYFDKIQARYLRVSFTKRDESFPFGDSEPFPWSVDVRNFRAVHLMQDSGDFVADSGVDILGNPFRNILQTFPATNADDGSALTFWMSQPNPTSSAVEAIYFDVSTTTHGVTMSELDAGLAGGGNTMTDYDNIAMSSMESYIGVGAGPQTVDEIFIDPVFSGSDMHFYWSIDPQPDWETKLWHPIPLHYKCTRGYHSLPYPVTARFFKIEFSNLTPVPYNTLDYPQLQPPLYRKYPSWVQNYFSALTPETLRTFDEATERITIDPYDMFKIQQDVLATTTDQQSLSLSEEPDIITSEVGDIVNEIVNLGDETIQIGQENKIRFFPPTVWRDDLKNVLDLSRAASRLIWQDEEDQFMVETTPEILDAPAEQSVEDLSREQAQKQAPIMWFPRICRHGYQVVTGPFQSKLAYQVAIREISFWYRGFVPTTDHSTFGVSIYGGTFYG
jgi:hypothetical protein